MYLKLEEPDRCTQLVDREHSLITDKHTEVLDCISCVLVFFLSTWHAEPIYRPLRSMHKRTDGRYQTYYLPGFAVDNKSGGFLLRR